MDDSKALQFYYTSCRSGLSGYPGFQTYVESMGVQPNERQELERKALYHPPRNLPHEPDSDTIAALFPKAFRTFRLSSGRIALMQSVYIGQDYSGRWGNFFSHGLILDELSQGKWPIDSYSWMGWVKNIENEEETGKLKALPAVAVAELTVGGDFEFDELKVFLGEEKERANLLAKMLDAVFSRRTDSRNVVIREVSELDAVYWIACIQKAFPPAYQEELTCSTFQFDPRNANAVNATLGETDFLFDDGEVNYQFYVFDFVSGKQSNVSSEYNEYTHTVAEWMKSRPDKLQKFHQFSDLFDCHKIGTELVSILRLYRLEQGENILFSPVDFHKALEFISTHARSSAVIRLLNSIKSKGVSGSLKKTTSVDEWKLVIRSLKKIATLTDEDKDYEELSSSWVAAFDHFVFHEHNSEEVVLSLLEEIDDHAKKISSRIAKAFLDDTHLDWIFVNIGSLSAKSLNIIASQIERSCHLLGRIPTHNCYEVTNLIECTLSNQSDSIEDFHWLFSVYQYDPDAIVSLVDQVLTMAESQLLTSRSKTVGYNIGKSLFEILASNENTSGRSAVRIEVLRRLVLDVRFLDVILGEWKSSLIQEKNASKAYDYYDKNILSDNTRRVRATREVIALELLKTYDDKGKTQQALYWVESGECQKFTEKFSSDILELASKKISLLPEDKYSKKLADKIYLVTRSWGKKPKLHRIILRDLVESTLNETMGEEKILELLESLDEMSYGQYLDVVLPRKMSEFTTSDSHRGMLIYLIPNKSSLSVFEEKYLSIINDNYFNKFSVSCIAIISFWIKVSEKDKCWSKIAGIRNNIMKNLVSSLAVSRKSVRIKIIDNLRKSPGTDEYKREVNLFSKKVNDSVVEPKSFFAGIFKKT